MGMDQLPGFIKYSSVLTGNQKAQLAGVVQLPERDPCFRDERMEAFHFYMKDNRRIELLFDYAGQLLEENKVKEAWQVLLSIERLPVPV